MITFQKYLIYSLSVLLMAALILFLPNTANASAIFFQTIIGAFLGLDLAVALKTTYTLPEGQFKSLKKDRYIYAGVTNIILLSLSIYLFKVKSFDLSTCISIFSSGLFLIMIMYIGGLEGTKLLTFSDPGQNIDKPTEGK
jgi:hypothetical protein